MGYNIEVSIDIVKNGNFSTIKREIADNAIDYECDHYYYLYDIEGGTKHKRNHCIIIINFTDENIFYCAEFIKFIKKQKEWTVHVECIYEDDIQCKLIYASSCYQKKMNKEGVIKYNKFKRERSHSDNEKILLNEVKK